MANSGFSDGVLMRETSWSRLITEKKKGEDHIVKDVIQRVTVAAKEKGGLPLSRTFCVLDHLQVISTLGCVCVLGGRAALRSDVCMFAHHL